MSKAIFTLLSLFLITVPLHGDGWESVIKKAQNSVVFVENKGGSCTGFVINQTEKFVMTAAHCAADQGDVLWVDRVKAEPVSVDTAKDLMVVKVPFLDPTLAALSLAAHDPKIRQDVLSVGYGYGLERPVFKTAHVADTATNLPDLGGAGPFIAVDAAYTPGQSGGPVLDISGNIVSIVQRSDGGTLGVGVGAELIKERMGRFFETAPTK